MRAHRSNYDIRITVCENDEQGNPAGIISAIIFEDPQDEEECLSLEHNEWFVGGAAFAASAGRILSIHGYDFKYSNRHTWVGNMRWNEYALPARYAVGLLNVLRRSRQWEPISGLTTLLRKWTAGDEITCADFGFSDIPAADQTGVGFHRSGRQLMLFWSDKPAN